MNTQPTNDQSNDSSDQTTVFTSCIFFTDQDGRVTSNSDAAAGQFLDRNSLLDGKTARESFSNPRLSQAMTNAQSAFDAGESNFLEVLPWDNNASLRFQATVVTNEHNSIQGYAYSICVQPACKQSELAETILGNLLQHSQDMIYFKDLDSKFTRVSESTAERLGAENAKSMIGHSDFDYLDKECAQVFFNDEQEIIRTGKPLTSKTDREQRIDGESTWVLSTKMPLLDKDKNVVGTWGISKDITRQKKTEQELEQTHRKLVNSSRHAGMAEIATNVIHNVGNVLNSINVSISHTREISSGAKVDKLQKVAEMLRDNANQVDFLSENEKGKRIPDYLSLLSEQLSKDQAEIDTELAAATRHLQHIKTIVAMQQEYATANCIVEKVDVAELLEDAIGMSSGSLERHRITLVRDFDPGITLMLDKHHVMQILVNLIRNAKHAVQEINQTERQIKLSVKLTGDDQVTISVIDNGIGISPENLTKLFNHGFTTKKDGHGFGLHSGANSAKELGGSLTARSEGLGHGATFNLTLPIAKSEAEPNKILPILHQQSETMPTALDSPVA